jgi:ArsR family transcriptional regulator
VEVPVDTSVLEYFQRVAKEWDTLRSTYYDESVIVKTLEHAPVAKSQTVVDVGTGTGFMAAGLAPLARQVIGVDFSDAMLTVARENMVKLGLTNVEFRQGTLQQLPLDDVSADVVVANMALHHAPGPLAALQEMTRVCKPGGRVVITDAVRHTFEWFKTELADVWLGFTPEEIGKWYSGVGLSSQRYELIGKR